MNNLTHKYISYISSLQRVFHQLFFAVIYHVFVQSDISKQFLIDSYKRFYIKLNLVIYTIDKLMLNIY